MRYYIVSVMAGAILSSGLRADDLNPTPTYSVISYGPHAINVLDFWKAPGDSQRLVLVYIHGGGWIFGDKELEVPALKPFLDKGISCASISYRLTTQDGLPAPIHDAARAIQFLRTKSAAWNIDIIRIALTGGSAGACTSMWILLHDDLADPRSDEPVRRQSTRVCAAAVQNGQTTIDPPVLKDWLGKNGLAHPMICRAVGELSIDDVIRNYDKYRKL